MDIFQINVEGNQAVQHLEAILGRMEMLLNVPAGTESPGVI